MKSKMFKLFGCLVILFGLTGCVYMSNYIKKYDDELHAYFGDFTYEHLGVDLDGGVDGLGAHHYRRWEVRFKDQYNIERRTYIDNDFPFDIQINDIYRGLVLLHLSTKVMNKYTNCNCDDDELLNQYVFLDCFSKKYDYRLLVEVEHDFKDYYDEDKNEIKNEKFYNFTKTDIYDLIDNGNIKISHIKYLPEEEIVLSDEELDLQVEYLENLTREIDNEIPVDQAYYRVHRNDVNYKGEDHIATDEFELFFK